MMFEIRNGTVSLDDWVVFEGLNLRVEPGEIVSVLGPSGCGKTTLLRASCGLERLKEGQRLLDEEVLENATIVPTITMLFQQPVLYPHLNVAQNIALGAPKTMSKMAVKQRVDEVLQSIGLADFHRRGTAGLSGGEAQRVKLASELRRPPHRHTMYILDEPTTGLSFSDVQQLIDVLLRLRKTGHSIIVIEHHMDVIKSADWVVDLGPEGGDRGGQVVAVGTPEEVAKVKGSFTGQFLKEIL